MEIDKETLDSRIQQASDCVRFLNEHQEVWLRLHDSSYSLLVVHAKRDKDYCFPSFSKSLIPYTKLLQQYQEYKHDVKVWNAGNPVYSEYWLPISTNYVAEETYIDLSSAKLPILVASWKLNEHYVKTACPSLLKFIKAEKKKNRQIMPTLKRMKSFWNMFAKFFKRAKEEKPDRSAKDDNNDNFAKYKGLGKHNPRLIDACNRFCGSLSKISLKNSPNLNALLTELPDLNLDEMYVLDNYNPQPDSPYFRDIGQHLRLYARLKSVEKPCDVDFAMWYNRDKKYPEAKPLPEFESPFKHITLPFTEEAIWQAYLLKQTKHKIGMWWHGLYKYRVFINQIEDIDHLTQLFEANYNELNHFKSEAKANWSESMSPVVFLDDDKAYISHYWFDYWYGLRQVECLVKYNPHSHTITDFQIKESEAIVRFHCGIMF